MRSQGTGSAPTSIRPGRLVHLHPTHPGAVDTVVLDPLLFLTNCAFAACMLHLALAADSGGPYGRVKKGLLDIAQASGSLLVPLIFRGHRVVRLRRPVTHYVPLPFCSLVVHDGEPLDAQRIGITECQEAMDRLEREHGTTG